MNDFWKSYDITHAEYGADYRCYPLYGTVHLMELAISLALIVGRPCGIAAVLPHPAAHFSRSHRFAPCWTKPPFCWGMALTGQWNWSYLPLHLCNINVFVCLYNTITDRNCKRGAVCPLYPGQQCCSCSAPAGWMLPSWWTLINLHSVSIHALLVLYPVLLVAGGYRPSPGGCRRCWRSCSALPCLSTF